MTKSRFSDSQILVVLKQAESGVSVLELCREYGISSATLRDFSPPASVSPSTSHF